MQRKLVHRQVLNLMLLRLRSARQQQGFVDGFDGVPSQNEEGRDRLDAAAKQLAARLRHERLGRAGSDRSG